MPEKVIVTITIDYEFIDKFIGMLKNITAVSDKQVIEINSVIVDDGIVAYPKKNDS